MDGLNLNNVEESSLGEIPNSLNNDISVPETKNTNDLNCDVTSSQVDLNDKNALLVQTESKNFDDTVLHCIVNDSNDLKSETEEFSKSTSEEISTSDEKTITRSSELDINGGNHEKPVIEESLEPGISREMSSVSLIKCSQNGNPNYDSVLRNNINDDVIQHSQESFVNNDECTEQNMKVKEESMSPTKSDLPESEKEICVNEIVTNNKFEEILDKKTVEPMELSKSIEIKEESVNVQNMASNLTVNVNKVSSADMETIPLKEYDSFKEIQKAPCDPDDLLLSSDSSDSSDESSIIIDTEIEKPKTASQQSGPKKIKNKGELDIEDLPPIEDLHITVPEDECKPLGQIYSIVSPLVVVQSLPNTPALDLDSVLFREKGECLGVIFDVFGPVKRPFYCVRFNSQKDIIEKGIEVGQSIYCAPQTDYTRYIFTYQLMMQKGSDASWRHNQEPPESALDFSDDEEEKRVKNKSKMNKNIRPPADIKVPVKKSRSASDPYYNNITNNEWYKARVRELCSAVRMPTAVPRASLITSPQPPLRAPCPVGPIPVSTRLPLARPSGPPPSSYFSRPLLRASLPIDVSVPPPPLPPPFTSLYSSPPPRPPPFPFMMGIPRPQNPPFTNHSFGMPPAFPSSLPPSCNINPT